MRSNAAESSTSSANATMSKVPRKIKREGKRIRGEIACAECRRLKVRCDRVVPCSTCVKRGCAALCPNGTIPPGEGSRFVEAATEHLETKLIRMEKRMHSLEDALAIIHISDQPHPLLAKRDQFMEELNAGAPNVEVGAERDSDKDEQNEVEAKGERKNKGKGKAIAHIFESAKGPLSMGGALFVEGNDEHEAARYFGPSGGSETLLVKEKDITRQLTSSSPPTLDPSYLPEEILRLSEAMPFSLSGIPPRPTQVLIERYLPPVASAVSLCETYLRQLSWMTQIVSRSYVIGKLIPTIYGGLKHKDQPSHHRSSSSSSVRYQQPYQQPVAEDIAEAEYGPHDLSLLFILLAVAVLVDTSRMPYHIEAQHFYRLARAALVLQPPLKFASITTVKAMHLMSIYDGLSGVEQMMERSYAMLRAATDVALRIGLHMDPTLWGLRGREVYERRAYFWNLVVGECWQSLITGRPPAFVASFIDCHMPTEEDEAHYQAGEVQLGFGTWGFRYTVECILPVVRATLSAQPPSYEAVLELDRKIRAFASTPANSPIQSRHDAAMRVFVRSHYQHLILLFLHRSFFARAISKNPADPAQSEYATSYITAYECACTILASTAESYSRDPLLTPRIWRIWSYAFSAAVVAGAVAARPPSSRIGGEPLHQFDQACMLFQKAAETSTRAARALPILLRIREKAYQSRYPSKLAGTVPNPPVLFSQEYHEDELAIFGGNTVLFKDRIEKEGSGASTTAATASITAPSASTLSPLLSVSSSSVASASSSNMPSLPSVPNMSTLSERQKQQGMWPRASMAYEAAIHAHGIDPMPPSISSTHDTTDSGNSLLPTPLNAIPAATAWDNLYREMGYPPHIAASASMMPTLPSSSPSSANSSAGGTPMATSAVDFVNPTTLFGAGGTDCVLGSGGAIARDHHSSQLGGLLAPRQHSHHHHHQQRPHRSQQTSMRSTVSTDAHVVNSDSAMLDDRWSAFMHGFSSVIAAE